MNQDQPYKGLSNEEIIMIYYRFDKYLSGLNANLERNMISKSVNTPFGAGIAMVPVPSEHVTMFKETQYYQILNSIVEKLKPVVELLEDCDPEMKLLGEKVK